LAVVFDSSSCTGATALTRLIAEVWFARPSGANSPFGYPPAVVAHKRVYGVASVTDSPVVIASGAPPFQHRWTFVLVKRSPNRSPQGRQNSYPFEVWGHSNKIYHQLT
jgi:hypothetical protein